MTAATARLARRVTVIVGGSSTMGRNLCSALLREGAYVVLGDDPARTRALGPTLVDERLLDVPTNLRDNSEIRQLMQIAMDQFGGLHSVLNVAGVSTLEAVPHPASDYTLDDIFDVSVGSVYSAVEAAAPLMQASDGGSITTLIPDPMLASFPNSGAYAAGQATLLTFTRAAAARYAGTSVRLNAVCFGLAGTQEQGDVNLLMQSSDRLSGRKAVGWGDRDDIVDMAMFLASDQASSISGSIVHARGSSSSG